MIEILICLMSLEVTRSSEDIIDVNDILSEDLMPTSLLIWEDPEKARKFNNESASEVTRFKSDGSLVNAVATMGFHRTMMNQYLCRSYVADHIVSNMTLTRIKRRMGVATGKEENSTNARTEATSIIKNNLMNDEGSSGYQDWLLKTTTLEDLYKHYNHAGNRVDEDMNVSDDKADFDMEFNGQKAVPALTMHKSGTNGPIKQRGQKDDMFYGGGSAPAEGYQHSSLGGGPIYPHSSQGGGGGYQHSGGAYQHSGGGYQHSGGGGGYQHSGGGGGFYGGNGHGYVESPPIHEHEHVYIHHTYPPKSQGHYEHHSGGGKENELADLFEVALTALAYLAFGMFLVHVVMCISAINNVATTTMASMMPMSMGPTATAAGMTGSTGMGGGMTGTGNGGGTTSTGNGGTTGTGNGGGTTGGTGEGATGNGGGATGAGVTGAGGGTEGGGDTEPGSDTGGGGDTGMGGDNGNGGATGGGSEDTTGNGGDAGTGGGADMDGGNGGNGDSAGDGMTDNGGDTGNGNGDAGDATGDTDDNGGTNGNGDTTGGAGPDEPGTGDGATGGTAEDGTVVDDAADNDEVTDMFQFRLKRDIPTLVNANNYYINELARRVLIAIETAMIANSDQGACLKKNLCETNKWSRSLDGKQRIIVPVFSLGMSWISGRLIKAIPPATSRLDALKAAVLGLGKANCEVIYQDCDLRKEISKRRLRRRRRKR